MMTTETKLTDDMIRELSILCTRNEAGQHFTEWSSYYNELEELGLVSVHRPIHSPTGIPYSQEYWSLEATEDGQDAVDANPELHPER